MVRDWKRFSHIFGTGGILSGLVPAFLDWDVNRKVFAGEEGGKGGGGGGEEGLLWKLFPIASRGIQTVCNLHCPSGTSVNSDFSFLCLTFNFGYNKLLCKVQGTYLENIYPLKVTSRPPWLEEGKVGFKSTKSPPSQLLAVFIWIWAVSVCLWRRRLLSSQFGRWWRQSLWRRLSAAIISLLCSSTSPPQSYKNRNSTKFNIKAWKDLRMPPWLLFADLTKSSIQAKVPLC